ncbi:MAG: glycosyltransferase family A protein [Salinivirgaceae bacterium]
MCRSIAFATVIFPRGIVFWDTFINSIKNQSFKDFKLVILNDGCDIGNLDTCNLDVVFIEAKGGIINNRNQLIFYLIEKKFEWVVFGDCDDYFESNRIQKVTSFMDTYDLIANEIVPIDKSIKGEKVFSKLLGTFSEIDLGFIRDKNLFGLSNVSCNVDYLKNINLNDDLVAADWTLFTKVMMNGAKACFTNETITYYRQWGENVIGIGNETKQKIITGIKTKYFHYKFLKDIDAYYEKEFIWIEKLYNKLLSNDIDNYCNAILNLNKESIFWWENIKNIKDDKN